MYQNTYYTIQSHPSDYDQYDIISDYFLEPERMKASRADSIPPNRWWKDNAIALFKRLVSAKTEVSSKNLREEIWKGVKECTSFKPTLAFTICKLFQATSVLDISAGWGDRLIGATAAGCSYVGYDPNTDLKPGHDQLISTLGIDAKVIYTAFENSTPHPCDLIFTSPPYYNFETYTQLPGQSILSYPSFEEWLVFFLFRSIEIAWKSLKPGGTMVLHITDVFKTHLCEAMVLFVEWKLPDSIFQGVIASVGDSGRPMPMWVWKKDVTLIRVVNPRFEAHYPLLYSICTGTYNTPQRCIKVPTAFYINDREVNWKNFELKHFLPYLSMKWTITRKDIEQVSDTLFKRGQTETIYPPLPYVFSILEQVALQDIKVVILGQDPYINPNEAIGIAFDCGTADAGKIPPSLQNIYKKLSQDGFGPVNIRNWPEKGIFLYNVTLTVAEGQSASHDGIWSEFTEFILKKIASVDHVAWILLGQHSKSYKRLITNKSHAVFESVHPSPLSAHKGFFTSNVFKDCAKWVAERHPNFDWK
jgi:uracil-DNA glycosylase